ncbi:Acriflavine sensitivity control protein acr-2 [Fusarium oxysporum f. sp. cubense race 1]|uniref:Acriflavine sensitivity control protein acr-2 n=1 Tax=Fusarium oxysporum f. sp. cubense (strain race 1) TaxID=1229664 RepID=N4U2U0_FUSC1|nr:Acriflavine sensitivity control protein acr-2 [Fusarium oxysporum f. sp. cubense race 1]
MTQSRTRKCWSCKQRRLKCDGGVPHCLKCWSHGVECLGYEKPLVWVEGVARRGPMKNRTFGGAQTQQSSQKASLQRPTPVVSHGHRHQKEKLTSLSGCIPMPVALIEPLFKDFSYTSRFFVDYCYLKMHLPNSGPSRSDQQSLLITVVLLAFLDIFESGSGAWSYHIEGIKKMLEVGAMKGTSSWDDNLQSLLYDAAMLQTFGSSLAKPGVLTSASTLSSIKASAFSTVTPNGCPVQILSTVEIFASQRRHDFVFAENATNIVVLEDALQKMRSYDIASWAVYNTTKDSKVSSEDLARLGTIWQLSADIYACRVLAGLTGSTLASESLQVQGLIAAYAFLERENDELIKCLIWPTFVAGAASTTYEARAWVLQTLDRIWSRGHCANTKNAAKVLGKLWEKYDQTNLSSLHIHNSSNATEHLSMGYFVWDWVNELSSLEGSWLFI